MKIILKYFSTICLKFTQKLLSSSNDDYSLELFENEINIAYKEKLIFPKGNVELYHEELLNTYNSRFENSMIKIY